MKKIRFFFPLIFLLLALSDFHAGKRVEGCIFSIGAVAYSIMLTWVTRRKLSQDKINASVVSSIPILPLHQENGVALRWILPSVLLIPFAVNLLLAPTQYEIFGSYVPSIVEAFVGSALMYLLLRFIGYPRAVDIDPHQVTFTPIPMFGYPKRQVETFSTSSFELKVSNSGASGGIGYRLVLRGSNSKQSAFINFPSGVNQLEYSRQLGKALGIRVTGLPEISSSLSAKSANED